MASMLKPSSMRAPQAKAMARGLGWFSLALGVAELLAAKPLARSMGAPGRADLVQAYGLREIATGVAILMQDDPRPGIWGRVAGDGLDLATLAAGMARPGAPRANLGWAMAAVAGVTALDLICAQQLEEELTPKTVFDYSHRSGLPRPPDEMRGVALSDFLLPDDMRREPPALQI